MIFQVLCEGPDDIAALREIACLLFAARIQPFDRRAGAAGGPRSACLLVGQNEVRVSASDSGKSKLPSMLATALSQIPPQKQGKDADALQRITVLYDPDDEPAESMCTKLTNQVAAEAKEWALEGGGDEWRARRSSDGLTLVVRAVPWRAPGDVVDGLEDKQNLERLLCFVAAAAYPNKATVVERWLGEMSSAGGQPSWKAALHLWCALVEVKATEANAPARFLRQNEDCRPHVKPTLENVSLLRDLSVAFGIPGR